jgi:hypothetical protein
MRTPIAGTYCLSCERAFVSAGTLEVTTTTAPQFFTIKVQMKAVLAAKTFVYLHGGNRRLSKREFYSLDLQELNMQATAKALTGAGIGSMTEQHRSAVSAAGGYLELLTKVADEAWGCGKNSIDVALAVGISRYSARQILHRLCETARYLGFEVGAIQREACANCGTKLTKRSLPLQNARAGIKSGLKRWS